MMKVTYRSEILGRTCKCFKVVIEDVLSLGQRHKRKMKRRRTKAIILFMAVIEDIRDAQGLRRRNQREAEEGL